jgi:putative FmdB family regulatory protein
MPTYDYECSACGHKFEQFQSITSDSLKKCPACRKSKLKRLIGTGAGIIFKGSGFYTTDYRSDSYKAAAKADSDKLSGTEAKTETKSDSNGQSKSEVKTEPKSDSKSSESKSSESRSSERKSGKSKPAKSD